jgi:hypothetical protein
MDIVMPVVAMLVLVTRRILSVRSMCCSLEKSRRYGGYDALFSGNAWSRARRTSNRPGGLRSTHDKSLQAFTRFRRTGGLYDVSTFNHPATARGSLRLNPMARFNPQRSTLMSSGTFDDGDRERIRPPITCGSRAQLSGPTRVQHAAKTIKAQPALVGYIARPPSFSRDRQSQHAFERIRRFLMQPKRGCVWHC